MTLALFQYNIGEEKKFETLKTGQKIKRRERGKLIILLYSLDPE